MPKISVSKSSTAYQNLPHRVSLTSNTHIITQKLAYFNLLLHVHITVHQGVYVYLGIPPQFLNMLKTQVQPGVTYP